MSDVVDAGLEFGTRLLSGGTQGGSDARRSVEPRTGASETRRQTRRVEEEERAAEQEAQQDDRRRRRRRENMARAALQPEDSLFDVLGQSQNSGQRDRLG